jgi:hypothetical protein
MTKLFEAATSHHVSTPQVVKWLGYGGLLPFVFLAAALAIGMSHSNLWLQALVGYGAVILSFVGALHWGCAMTHPAMTSSARAQSFVWSVVPSLVAWTALLLSPQYASFLLVLGFVVHLWRDKRLVLLVKMPDWYLPLRLQLTVVACLSLLSTYIF